MNVDEEEEGDNGNGAPVATIAVDESAAAAAEAISPMEKESKKRKAEDYSHASTQWWKKHFIMLEEFHYSTTGKKGHRLGICIHCKQASEEPTVEQCATIERSNYGRAPKSPNKMQIYARNCQSHLAKCKWIPRDVRLSMHTHRGGSGSVSASDRNEQVATGAVPRKIVSRTSVSSEAAASVASSMDIRGYTVRRGLSPAEIPKFHRLMFNLVVDTRNPFRFPREAAMEELCEFLRPGSSDHLPERRTIAGRLLREVTSEAKAADKYFKENLRKQGYMESVTIDGWKDVSKIHVEGV